MEDICYLNQKIIYNILKYLEKMTSNLFDLFLKCEGDEYTDFFILAQMTMLEDIINRFPLTKINVKLFKR